MFSVFCSSRRSLNTFHSPHFPQCFSDTHTRTTTKETRHAMENNDRRRNVADILSNFRCLATKFPTNRNDGQGTAGVRQDLCSDTSRWLNSAGIITGDLDSFEVTCKTGSTISRLSRSLPTIRGCKQRRPPLLTQKSRIFTTKTSMGVRQCDSQCPCDW